MRELKKLAYVVFISFFLSSCAGNQSTVDPLRTAAESGDPQAMVALGHRYMTGDGVEKDYYEALRWFEKGTSQGAVACENCLAWLLATCPNDKIRDGKRAVDIAEQVVARSPSAANVDTLAAAYAEVGRFDRAIATQQEALRMLNNADVARVQDYGRRLDSYRSNIPWRRP